MRPNEYQKQALRTDPREYAPAASRMIDGTIPQLLHAGMGMATEAGEFVDALKKHIYYGKPLDRTNLKEEIGDLLWYAALACDHLGYDLESAMEDNIAKLRIRFPEKFTEEKAVSRDTQKEMEAFGASD